MAGLMYFSILLPYLFATTPTSPLPPLQPPAGWYPIRVPPAGKSFYSGKQQKETPPQQQQKKTSIKPQICCYDVMLGIRTPMVVTEWKLLFLNHRCFCAVLPGSLKSTQSRKQLFQHAKIPQFPIRDRARSANTYLRYRFRVLEGIAVLLSNWLVSGASIVCYPRSSCSKELWERGLE